MKRAVLLHHERIYSMCKSLGNILSFQYFTDFIINPVTENNKITYLQGIGDFSVSSFGDLDRK